MVISVLFGFPQVRCFKSACKYFGRNFSDFSKGDSGTSFRALCTALGATIGTGNIAGVAGAIALGGPGAVFWMWVGGFLGMATKYAEGVLAAVYRCQNQRGEMVGGPMYMITRGLDCKWHFLAVLYSTLCVFSAFGVGNATQISAVSAAAKITANQLGIHLNSTILWVCGGVISLWIYRKVSTGSGQIGRTAERLIPVVSIGYILLCILGIYLHRDAIIPAIREILWGAFSPRAVTGGMICSMFTSLRMGISRGTFSNEAGMGTAAIAYGEGDDTSAQCQGYMGIMEVFIDTHVICSLTAMVILTSGIPIPFGEFAGAELTVAAFQKSFGGYAGIFLTGCILFFALGTVLGWGLYAARSLEFLFGGVRWRLFALIQATAVILSFGLETARIWSFSELLNGLMAMPNLLGIMLILLKHRNSAGLNLREYKSMQ